MVGMEKVDLMRAICDEVVGLTHSPLYAYRTENKLYPVIGEGSHDAEIMFIGEAPGKNEALTGRPFCGAAGKFLDELLGGVGIARGDVYITNIVKDRPPENRDPTQEEIAVYGPFLDRQIDIIRPKVIATLGRYSMAYVMNKLSLEHSLDSISRLHGTVHQGKTQSGMSVTVVPLYHPAAALYNGSLRSTLAKDFAVLKRVV